MEVAQDRTIPKGKVEDIYTSEGLWKVIDNLPMAIAVIDADINIVLTNQIIEKFLNKTRFQMVGKVGGDAIGCIHRLDSPKGCGFGKLCFECKLRRTIQNTFKKDQPIRMVGVFMTLEGIGGRHLRISTLPLALHQKRVVLLAMEDLTEMKAHEKDAMEKARLSAAIKTAGAVCHEINQPLMVIMGYVDLLSDSLSPDSSELEKLAAIKTEVKRLGSITGKLMDITTFKTKKYLNTEIIDLDASSQRK